MTSILEYFEIFSHSELVSESDMIRENVKNKGLELNTSPLGGISSQKLSKRGSYPKFRFSLNNISSNTETVNKGFTNDYCKINFGKIIGLNPIMTKIVPSATERLFL